MSALSSPTRQASLTPLLYYLNFLLPPIFPSLFHHLSTSSLRLCPRYHQPEVIAIYRVLLVYTSSVSDSIAASDLICILYNINFVLVLSRCLIALSFLPSSYPVVHDRRIHRRGTRPYVYRRRSIDDARTRSPLVLF